MIKMSEASRKLLEENFPEFFKIADINEALSTIHDYIVLYGMDSDDLKTEFGYQLEDVYDDIYFSN